MINHQRLLGRFLRYVRIDTTAGEPGGTYPSSPGQLVLGKLLADELREMGLKDVERALKLDANSAEAYWARGEVQEAQGRSALAATDYAKALSLDPRLKDAKLALARVGAAPLIDPEEEVADAGFERWRVFAKWPQYVASNDQFPRLKVDIEMLGKGQPRILEWEVKAAPFAGIAWACCRAC